MKSAVASNAERRGNSQSFAEACLLVWKLQMRSGGGQCAS